MAKTPDTTARCLFVGPFPPPVHGQSVATQVIADQFAAAGIALTRIDDSGSAAERLKSLGKTMRAIAFGNDPLVYLSVNSNTGAAVTALLAWCAHRAGKRVMLHHHSYRFIGTPTSLMDKIARWAGSEAVHIVNCPDMGALLQGVYPSIREVLPLSNIASVDASLQQLGPRTGPVAIGHMSNLTEAKGVGRVVDAAIALKAAGHDIRLEVAGPDSDPFAAAKVAEARAALGEAFHYHGPVYGEAKLAFFRAIDIFAFPSLYPTETQGIVNLEAMACGRPVVAFAQCCIPGDIGETGGVAVAKDADYTAALGAYVTAFAAEREQRGAMARARFEALSAEYEAQIAGIIALARDWAASGSR